MPRRRPDFATYLRRRWRVAGFFLVLLAGALLVLAITDRGHDPIWGVRGEGVVSQTDLSPHGSLVYSLLRTEATVTALQARDAHTGALLWESPLNATRAFLAPTPEGAVVATDAPRPLLTYYDEDGAVRYQFPLDGAARALAAQPERVAVAVEGPENPVVLIEEGAIVARHSFATFVNAVDLQAGRLAVATGDGKVALFSGDGRMLLNESLPMSVRSLRLSGDGSAIVVGGFSLAPGDLSGYVAYLDSTQETPLRWQHRTAAGVGYVDADRAAIYVVAVQQSPPQDIVVLYEGATGAVLWSHRAEGTLARGDAGGAGGLAMAPDGSVLVEAPLSGSIRVYGVRSGEPLWAFRSEGTTDVSFAAQRPDWFVANARLLTSGAFDSLLLFDVREEPPMERFAIEAALATGVVALVAVVVLGGGYWRVRRSY